VATGASARAYEISVEKISREKKDNSHGERWEDKVEEKKEKEMWMTGGLHITRCQKCNIIPPLNPPNQIKN
jgi:hypothetical protein